MVSEDRSTLRLLFWESTIRCNLNCAHCRRIAVEEVASHDMTTSQAGLLIEQLAGLGRRQQFMPILVFSGGEPLCRHDVFELMTAATAAGLRCALATNGTLINHEIAAKLKAVGIERVSVSLDGATAGTHDRLRRQEGSFEAALAGIECLRRAEVAFQINMTVTCHNVHELEELFNLAAQRGAAALHLFMLVPVGCGQEFAQSEMLSAKACEQLLRQIARQESHRSLEIKVTCGPHYQRVIREQKVQSKSMTKGCLAGSGVLFVSHDGRVFPCGYLPIECGNILISPLETIWKTSPDLARLRDVRQLKGKCGLCEFKNVCGGCRARAFAAGGDYMEAEPMCSYKPASGKTAEIQ